MNRFNEHRFFIKSKLRYIILCLSIMLLVFSSCKKESESVENKLPSKPFKYANDNKLGYMKIEGYVLDTLGNKIAWNRIVFREMILLEKADSNNVGYFICWYTNRLDKFNQYHPMVLIADSIITETDTLSGSQDLTNCFDHTSYEETATGYFYNANIVAK